MSSHVRLAGILTGGLSTLVLLMGIRAALLPSVQVAPDGPPTPADTTRAATLLSEAVSFSTVSGAGDHSADFEALGSWMDSRFPAAATVLRKEVGPGYARMYIWPGTDPGLSPILFLAHQDVVPVEAGTETDWAFPPFSGAIAPCGNEAADCVWGRGAADMKLGIVGLLDAADTLAQAGWVPARTLMFWFSDDEEVGGEATQALARRLAESNTRLAVVFDEGLVLTDGLVPGMEKPVALIGVAEKGYLTLDLLAHGEMGHSSMPPPETAVGVLARAITTLEQDPFPAKLDGPAESMFAHLAPDMRFPERLIFSNIGVFRSIVLRQLTASRSTNALVRTTQAATQLSASPKDNVLPQSAQGTVNLRLHPRDTIEAAVQRIEGLLAEARLDVDVTIRDKAGNVDPVQASPSDGPGYAMLANAIRRQIPESVVAPGLFIAASDSRHLVTVSDAIYRFTPVRMRPEDLGRVHGTNERVRVEDLGWALAIYKDLVQAAGSAP